MGPAHYECNLNRNYKNFKIPVFFHNGKGYDAHFIIQELSNIEQIEQINIIPKNEETYITYGFNNLKFVDSISFMNPDDSLDKLAKSLRNNDAYETRKFKQNKQYFFIEYPFMTDEDFKLVITKGSYPHEYMNNFDRFNETNLPDIKCFVQVLMMKQ